MWGGLSPYYFLGFAQEVRTIKIKKGFTMQLTIEIPNQPLYDKIVWFLSKFKDEGLKIIAPTQNKQRGLDTMQGYSSVEHLVTLQGIGKEIYKNIDSDAYLREMRDEW